VKKRVCMYLFTALFVSCMTVNKGMVSLSVESLENGLLMILSPELSEPVIFKESGSLELPTGASVTVRAVGSEGYSFNKWVGLEADEEQSSFTVEKNMKIAAEFVKAEYSISFAEIKNGSISVTPEIIRGKKYPANTQFTVSAQPSEGYDLDAVYITPPGQWWQYYNQFPRNPASFMLTADMELGAAFIPSEEMDGFSVIQDVIYALPGVKALKYDVFTPDNAKNLPLVIIIHGGGWSTNNEDVMRGMGREIARTGRYVAVSIDYRWIGHLDGDPVPNDLMDLIEDAYGAIAHIIEHAGDYGADPERIAVTGDSAGGHLSASVATMIERIGDGKSDGYDIMPTYLPEGVTADMIRETLAHSLKAAAPSYGVFDSNGLRGFLDSEEADSVSPVKNIPSIESRAIPHILVRGTEDSGISEECVLSYVHALESAGQEAVYVPVEGAKHAFYDWKPDLYTQGTFNKYGVPNIGKMLNFFDRYMQ